MTSDAPCGSDEIVDAFISYFRGRGDCYGSAKGFCVKQPLTRAVFERHLTSTNPDDHIGVYCMVGELCSWGCIDIDGKDFPIETVIPGEYVWNWSQMWTLARNLQTVLAVKGIIAHRERSKNGFHVWVFPDTPLVPAKDMRRALMAACKAVGYDPKEVNPKAEGPRPGTQGLGNFVRTPYGGSLASTQTSGASAQARQELDPRESRLAGGDHGGRGELSPDEGEGPNAQVHYRPADDGRGRRHPSAGSGWCGRCGHTWGSLPFGLERHLRLAGAGAGGSGSLGARPATADEWTSDAADPRWPERVFEDHEQGYPLCLACALADLTRTPAAALAEVAKLWTPPPVAHNEVDYDAGLDAEPLLRNVDGKTYTIWKDGPLPGSDRSTTLARLAHLCYEQGLPATHTFAIVKSADIRWGGKFANRGDGLDQMARIVENAYL